MEEGKDDFMVAREWFKKAENPIDPKVRFCYYLKAAEMGHPEACFACGIYFERNRFYAIQWVIVDDNVALEWFNKAAKMGHIEAHYQIANHHENARECHR